DRAFPLACSLGPEEAREPILLAAGIWNPLLPLPDVRLALRHAPYRIRRPRSWRFLAQHLAPMLTGTGLLWLGHGIERGEFVGVVHRGGEPEPVTALRLIGPGLERVPAVDYIESRTPSLADHDRWSRHIGALDEATWSRQRTLRVTVVGAGRMG